MGRKEVRKWRKLASCKVRDEQRSGICRGSGDIYFGGNISENGRGKETMKGLWWILIGGFVLMQVLSNAFDGEGIMDGITKYDNVMEYQTRDGYQGGNSAGKGYTRYYYIDKYDDRMPERSRRTGRFMD